MDLNASARRPSLIAWIALALVAGGVLWLFAGFSALPFQDLPAHAGFIALRQRFADSDFERRFFVVAPRLGPYSLFHWLGGVLAGWLGPVGAVRALAALSVIATPLAVLFARRRLHGDAHPAFGHLGLTLALGYMTVLGFASYQLGVAVALVGLTLWLQLLAAVDEGDRSARWRELAVAALAPLVLVSHGHAFLVFVALAGVSALAAGQRARRVLRLRALAPALALAAYMVLRDHFVPVAGAAPVAAGAGQMLVRFQGPIGKLGLLFTATLMTRTGVDVAIGLLVWLLIGAGLRATLRAPPIDAPADAGPRWPGRKKAIVASLVASMVALAFLFLVLPNAVGWFAFVDGRLVPLLPLLALLTMRPATFGPRLRAAWEWGSPLLAAALVALLLVLSFRFQEEAAGYQEVLRQVPANQRLLNLPLEPDSAFFAGHPFIHYDKLALVDRPLVVSDVWFHPGAAIYPTSDNPALRLPASYSASNLKAIDWPAYRLGDWDYALIRTRTDGSAPPVPAALRLTDHRGGWWLYQRVGD